MLEDQLLKWKFRNGSTQALSRIYEKYADFLLTLAVALLNDVNTAEDVLHDVFISFANSAEKFRLRGSLKSYLATCIVNRVRDRMRADKRRPVSLQAAELTIADYNSPYEQVLCSEESRLLNSAVARLPYEQREVVVLHIKGGLKFKDIAKQQGVSINTVQGRYRYGLNKLRSILDSEVEK